MTATAERMKTMRARRRNSSFRDVRLTVPDSRLSSVQNRIATQVAGLDQADEAAALNWIEAVCAFDGPDAAR